MANEKRFYGWWIVFGAVIILVFLSPAAVALANIFQTSVTNDFGISNTQFALSNSILQLMGVFFSPIVARLLVWDFKKFHALGVVLYAVCYAAYGMAANIYVFYGLSVLIGIAYQLSTMIPMSMLITNWFVEKRGLALSIAFSGVSIGGAVLSPVLTVLIENLGWRETYFLYGGAMLLICLPVSLFLLREKPADMGLLPLGEGAGKDAGVHSGSDKKAQTVNITVNQSFRKPFFVFLLLGSMTVGISVNAGLGQFPPFLQGLYGPETAALIISVYSLAGIPGKLVLGAFNDRFGIRASIVYVVACLIGTYWLMTAAEWRPGMIWFALVAAVLFGFGNAVGTILNPLVTSEIFSAQAYPIAYGYVNSATQLGLTAGSVLAAFLADTTGRFAISWLVASVVVVFVSVFWLVALKNARRYA